MRRHCPPLVMESRNLLITVLRSRSTEMLPSFVTINLATLTALESTGWHLARSGQPTQILNSSFIV